MLDFSDPMVLSTLVALAEACNYSTNAHVPEGAVLRGTASHLQGDMKKTLKKLAKEGYAIKHPTAGDMTYYITKDGIDKIFAFKTYD